MHDVVFSIIATSCLLLKSNPVSEINFSITFWAQLLHNHYYSYGCYNLTDGEKKILKYLLYFRDTFKCFRLVCFLQHCNSKGILSILDRTPKKVLFIFFRYESTLRIVITISRSIINSVDICHNCGALSQELFLIIKKYADVSHRLSNA